MVRLVLSVVWDPIHVFGLSPSTLDEYDGYAERVLAAAEASNDQAALEKFLANLQADCLTEQCVGRHELTAKLILRALRNFAPEFDHESEQPN